MPRRYLVSKKALISSQTLCSQSTLILKALYFSNSHLAYLIVLVTYKIVISWPLSRFFIPKLCILFSLLVAYQKKLPQLILEKLYSKSWIIATYPLFLLLFRFGNRKEDDRIKAEGYSKESNTSEQILRTSLELGVLSCFLSNKSTGPDRLDSIVGGSYCSISGESRLFITSFFGYSMGRLIVKYVITLLTDWVELFLLQESNIDGLFVNLTISAELLWFSLP